MKCRIITVQTNKPNKIGYSSYNLTLKKRKRSIESNQIMGLDWAKPVEK